MRLFIAAELPGGMREALAETQAALRDAVRGRFVLPTNLHLTLAFLGEVDAARVDGLADVLKGALVGHEPLDASLAELGSFGHRRAATLWQAVRGEGLGELAADVRAALRRFGFTFDERGFRAHVTLMRAADLTEGELPMPVLGQGWIRTVTLFRSDLSGSQPVYDPLASVRLGTEGRRAGTGSP